MSKEYITSQTIIENIWRTKSTRIGEISNLATRYINKGTGENAVLAKYYSNCVDELAIVNSKEIDSVKHGVKPAIRSKIQKRAGLLPYFMKYAGAYYAKQSKFSFSHSNMNKLCWETEKWLCGIKWERPGKSFDWRLYYDEATEVPEELLGDVREIQREYCRTVRELMDEKRFAREKFVAKWKKKKRTDEGNGKRFKPPMHLFDYDIGKPMREAADRARSKVFSLTQDKNEIANCICLICYKDKRITAATNSLRFAWIFGDCLAGNIKPVLHGLPLRCDGDGDFTYLGSDYVWKGYRFDAGKPGLTIETEGFCDFDNSG